MNLTKIKRLRTIIVKLKRLKYGHTLLPSEIEGYPPKISWIDRFGQRKRCSNLIKNNLYKLFEKDQEFKKRIDLIEMAWQVYLNRETPMGELFKTNSLLDSVKEGKGLTLLHITSSLKKIKESQALYPSGGALGACIYGVPLRTDCKIHNLAEFILGYELPRSLAARGKNDSQIGILAIHLHPDNFKTSNEESSGIDYVRFGTLRINAFYQLTKKGVLPKEEIQRLKNLVIEQMKISMPFLQTCSNYDMGKISNKEFKKLFQTTLDLVTSLRTVYFEILLEYVLLFQNDQVACQYKEQRELYNWHHKKMIFELCPFLFKNFKLTYFNPPLDNVLIYLKEKSMQGKIICNFSEEHFLEFIKWRAAQYIRFKILDGNDPAGGNFTFDQMVRQNPSFVGHIIHREIKNVHEYEKEMAINLWDYWDKNNILCPIYSPVPKGEIGINPAYTSLKYSIYQAELDPISKKVNLKKEIKVKIVPTLINPLLGTMRAPHS